ncbi:MAG: ABC transporter permease [Bacteroidota bacterium]
MTSGSGILSLIDMAGEKNPFYALLEETGSMSRFFGRFLNLWFRPRYELLELLRQCFFIGYQSLSLVGITAFIMGLVLTIQSRPTLVEFGAESMLPAICGKLLPGTGSSKEASPKKS